MDGISSTSHSIKNIIWVVYFSLFINGIDPGGKNYNICQSHLIDGTSLASSISATSTVAGVNPC